MYLNVKFKDGTETQIPLSHSHTLHVLTPPPVQVQDGIALNDVQNLSLRQGEPKAAE